MKRSRSNSSSHTPETSPEGPLPEELFDPLREVQIDNLPAHVDERSFITGTVSMKWPKPVNSQSVRLQLTCSTSQKVDVEFCSSNAKLDFSIADQLAISLRGVKFEQKMKPAQSSTSLPFKLIFSKEYAIKYLASPKRPMLEGLVISSSTSEPFV